jgi:hypothetical protein
MRLAAVSRKGDDHNILRVTVGELLKALPDCGDGRLLIRKQHRLTAKGVGEKRMQGLRVTVCAAEPIDFR